MCIRDSNPTVSDKEYDVLYDRLLAMEKETGVVLENSPTQRVGGAVDVYKRQAGGREPLL